MKITYESHRSTGRILAAIAFTVLMVGGTAGTASAHQEVATRSGFHFAVGAGSASMAASCAGCGTDFFANRLNGFSGVLQLGGMATSRLAIAGEFMGWMKNDNPVLRRVAGLSIVLLGYPSETGGFFFKGGLGGIRAIAEDDVLLIQTDAFMSTTGVGVDIPLGPSTMLSPYVNYIRSFGGETWVNGILSPITVSPNAVQFGVALTVH